MSCYYYIKTSIKLNDLLLKSNHKLKIENEDLIEGKILISYETTYALLWLNNDGYIKSLAFHAWSEEETKSYRKDILNLFKELEVIILHEDEYFLEEDLIENNIEYDKFLYYNECYKKLFENLESEYIESLFDKLHEKENNEE